MKRNILFITAIASALVFYASCTRDTTYRAPFTPSTGTGMAYLRIIHASPSFRAIYGIADSFNVYINNAKVNSPFMTFGSVFPAQSSASGLNGYMSVHAGLQQIRLSVNGIVSVDSLTITNYTKVMVADQYYSFFITDSINSGKDSSQIFVQDNFTTPIQGYYNLRFVNAITNDSASIAAGTNATFDIFSYSRNTSIWTKIRSDSATSFQLLGGNLGVTDTFYITRNPTTAGLPLTSRVVLAKIAFTPTNQRSYTLFYRGDGTLTSGTKARTLTTYVHN